MQLNAKRLVLVVVILGLCLAVLATAIPKRLNYQGVLKNKSTGRVLPDGNYTLIFRLYTASTGGSALWTETATATITNGVLAHQLGSVSTLNLAFDQNYYLGVQVSGDSEMSPRERLTSVGYAYTAVSASTANTLQGYVPSDFGDITQVYAGNGLRGGASYGAATIQVNTGAGLSISNDTVVLSSSYQDGSAYDSRFLNADGDTWTGILYGNDSSSVYNLQLNNDGSGNAMYARNSSYNSTVYARQYGSGRAFSGYNHADYGTGVGGLSYGLNGIGVYGEAAGGIGVYGYSTITAAVFARNAGQGNALYAQSNNGWNTLEVKNAGGGRGIYAESSTWTGIKGVSYGGYGVSGESYTDYGTGAGGAMYGNTGGYGVNAYCAGSSGYGVYASAPIGTGVYGYSNSTNNAIYGRNAGSGTGVFGDSINGYGVKAHSNDNYALYVESSTYRGAYIKGSPGWYGLYVDNPSNHAGAYVGGTLRVTGNVQFDGNLTVSGSKTGFVVDLCKNSGTGTLEIGDVVIIQGSGPAVLGEIPVMLVAKTNTAYNTAVVGIVNRGISIGNRTSTGEPTATLGAESQEKEMVEEGSATSVIEPSQYVTVVTLGAYKAIKVDASFGAIQPGDLLVTSPNAGYAMKADSNLTKVGTVIGKALGSLATGQGTIPVFVGHQ